MATALLSAVRSISGNQPVVRRLPEKATQTFKNGVPVQLNAGYIQEWDGVTVAAGIVGVVKEYGSNLSSNGVAASLTFGSVPNQSSAVNIPRGAPFNDGKVTIEVAAVDSVFSGQVGPAQSVTVANVGVNYGMTKDTDGHWYVDTTKLGAAAVVKVVGLDTRDNAASPRGVFFVFLPAAQQLVA